MSEQGEMKLITMFEAEPGRFLSGEELSRRLSISRTAIWKQINKLRTAGYEFEAVPRVGYRLAAKPEPLDPERIMSGVHGSFGLRVHVLGTTVSTQEDARALAEQGACEGTLVIAEEQTGGRGRMGKSFFSPYGKGIWMSLLMRPSQPLRHAQQLTLLTGVAVQRAIQSEAGITAGIKWPNDLLVDGKKVCGILLESAAEDERVRYCIAGIGISANLNENDFPEELRGIATSLKEVTGRQVSRNNLIIAIMNEMEELYKVYNLKGFGPIAELWEQSAVTMNRRVTVTTFQGVQKGVAVGLHSTGALLVRTDTGEEVPIFSGDIRLESEAK